MNDQRYDVMSRLDGREDIPARRDCSEQKARDIIDMLNVSYVRRTGESFYTIPALPESHEAVIAKLRAALTKIAYEPIGALDAGYKEVMEGMEAIAREALR